MTRKLYYEDSHMDRFESQVTGCTEIPGGWEITLEATAFYPEGGGQAWDTGILGGRTVREVRERGEEVIHLCDGPLQTGEPVEGCIDFDRRFDRMQQHTGEHIVSGIIHRRYGFHNVGFHMGANLTEIDFDGRIPAEDLADIEAEANEALWKNIPVRCWYPSPEELPHVPYRSKKQLPWPVRVVEVTGYDACACCGTHLKATGEVGLIKLFSEMPLRGGSRIEMACGGRALGMLNRVYEQNRLVSQAFSAKLFETAEAARRMNELLAGEKFRAAGLQRRLFALIAESYVNHGNVLHFESGLEPAMVRELADAIGEVCGATAAVFSGSDEAGYSYCLVSRQEDLRQQVKQMNQVLSGRGGGKPGFQQGSARCTRKQIEDFFR